MVKRRLKDGTILNAHTKIKKRPDIFNKYQQFGIHKAMITKRIPKDNVNNKWKRGVEYEATIVGGPRQGETIRNLIPLCSFGGNENYNEVVYKPKTQTIMHQLVCHILPNEKR